MKASAPWSCLTKCFCGHVRVTDNFVLPWSCNSAISTPVYQTRKGSV